MEEKDKGIRCSFFIKDELIVEIIRAIPKGARSAWFTRMVWDAYLLGELDKLIPPRRSVEIYRHYMESRANEVAAIERQKRLEAQEYAAVHKKNPDDTVEEVRQLPEASVCKYPSPSSHKSGYRPHNNKWSGKSGYKKPSHAGAGHGESQPQPQHQQTTDINQTGKKKAEELIKRMDSIIARARKGLGGKGEM